ncbi:MAG: dihydrofolate reductase family protein [Candidatus Odinarchaeota archaeon]
MRKVIFSMQVSLDGFISRPNGELDWLPPINDENLWKDIQEEMWNQLDSADTILLGRITYQFWENYWPNIKANPSSTENDIKFSHFADETQKIVFSKTLDKVEWKNTRLIKENIAKEILKMKKQSGKNMVIPGGASIAQTFMKLDLIDEYVLIIHPVILGSGKPLFEGLNNSIKLKLLRTRMLKSGAILVHYESVK